MRESEARWIAVRWQRKLGFNSSNSRKYSSSALPVPGNEIRIGVQRLIFIMLTLAHENFEFI